MGWLEAEVEGLELGLVEVGYLSNRQDERLLTSTRRRRALVEALAAGIERYFAKPRG